MSFDARRHASNALSAVAVLVTGLSAYNVYGDTTAVKAEAQRVAGCTPACEIAQEDRNPLRHEYTLAKKGGNVTARCARAFWLVGPYACTMK